MTTTCSKCSKDTDSAWTYSFTEGGGLGIAGDICEECFDMFRAIPNVVTARNKSLLKRINQNQASIMQLNQYLADDLEINIKPKITKEDEQSLEEILRVLNTDVIKKLTYCLDITNKIKAP